MYQNVFFLPIWYLQALDDLKSDEEIFADKEKEIADLKEAVGELENKLTLADCNLKASLSKKKE